MITEKFRGYPECPRNKPKISEMRSKIEVYREYLSGEINPSKRAIIEGEMASLARKILMHTHHNSKLRRTNCGRL